MAQGDINITVIGNLTEDPSLRYTPNGAAVTNFTVASTPRQYDRQSGEWKDGETVFMRCSIWKEAAENVAETLTRGSRVIATGRLKSRSYEKDGERRTSTELEVDEVGPSLRYATAKVNRIQRNTNAGNGGGWSKDFGQQQANNRDMRGGTTSDDPWATGGSADTNGQAYGSQEPPW